MKPITYNPETHVLVPRELNPNWCAGCSPDNCSGCGAGPVDSEPAMWVMKHIRSGDLAQAKPNQKALHPRMWSQEHLYTTPQPDRTAELEAALKVAREIAIDAATSLETIAIRSYGEDSYLDSKPQMRAFAQARASVAMKELTRINEVIGER